MDNAEFIPIIMWNFLDTHCFKVMAVILSDSSDQEEVLASEGHRNMDVC